MNSLRRRHRHVRGRLQAKRTRSARRRLRRRSGRERRFATDVNHTIAKQLVRRANAPAAGSPSRTSKVSATGSGLEGRSAAALHSWAFAQLGELIAYKAQLAGVPVDADIDPRNTSRQCPCCGHNSKPNRPSQARFRCVECGHRGHADYIAACNIAGRAAVNRPNVPKRVEFPQYRSKDKPTASAVGR